MKMKRKPSTRSNHKDLSALEGDHHDGLKECYPSTINLLYIYQLLPNACRVYYVNFNPYDLNNDDWCYCIVLLIAIL